MKILLTNDDGIDSPGLQKLKSVLSHEHRVWVIAPDGNRSGSSHSINLHAPIRISKIGKRDYSCGGSPADCILLGRMGLLPESIDMVISGINLGPNLGTDIVYSGTAAAARQGALMGIPSVACSLNAFSPPYHLEFPLKFILNNLERFCSLWAEDHFLNINFPNQCSDPPRTVVTFPTRRIYKDELVKFNTPRGDLYCFIGGAAPGSSLEAGSDCRTVEAGNISLSPILIHPTNHEIATRYKKVDFSCC